MLKIVFDHYALKENNMNVDSIKSTKFHKMMADAGVGTPGPETTPQEIKKRLDLIFCSVNRGKAIMDFECFLISLIKIAEFKFPELDQAKAL